MITLVEALRFRSLRDVRQELEPFQVLVGPNASGKTTFLDVIAFLGRLVSEGIDRAVGERTPDFRDLTWRREGGGFELAIEARIPDGLHPGSDEEATRPGTIRYEVALKYVEARETVEIQAERAMLRVSGPREQAQLPGFPRALSPRSTLLMGSRGQGSRAVLGKSETGNDNFYSEPSKGSSKNGGWVPSFRLGPRKSTLANLPEDESRFPVATWLKRLLTEGVQQLVLNSLTLRNASPPGQGLVFRPDGSNLPWVVADLERRHPDRVRAWVAHLRTALPELVSLRTVERPDDRHRYLVLGYEGGLEVPSWMVSDGTLRLLALTLPAYLPGLRGIFLIEEPENGIHPRAVEPLFHSLSSVYDAQILVATHSPVILSLVEPHQLLCFAKNEDGATDVVSGDEHPALRKWRGETNLSVLFAAGVLG